MLMQAEKDIRGCFAAGAVRVSIDFTECVRYLEVFFGRINIDILHRGRLAPKKDPRNPWTGENLLQSFVDLNNRQFTFVELVSI
jgi:hypothetical protein